MKRRVTVHEKRVVAGLISVQPGCVTVRVPPAFARHADISREPSAWMYNRASALGSTYTSAAVTAFLLPEPARRLGGERLRLTPPQPSMVVGRRAAGPGLGRQRLKHVGPPPLQGDPIAFQWRLRPKPWAIPSPADPTGPRLRSGISPTCRSTTSSRSNGNS